jgi:hypothetical protein
VVEREMSRSAREEERRDEEREGEEEEKMRGRGDFQTLSFVEDEYVLPLFQNFNSRDL